MDETVITLGKQIELYGFSSVERSAMLIVRKVVGNVVRALTEKYPSFQKLTLKLEGQEPLTLSAVLLYGEGTKEASAEGNNLFFTLDSVLKKL